MIKAIEATDVIKMLDVCEEINDVSELTKMLYDRFFCTDADALKRDKLIQAEHMYDYRCYQIIAGTIRDKLVGICKDIKQLEIQF